MRECAINMLKNIIFDMGNVLLDYDPEIPLNEFCRSEEEKDAIRRELFEGPEWVQGDMGTIRDADRYDLVKERVPKEMHPALKKCSYSWDICLKPVEGAREFCRKVKAAGYGVYVLSNASDKFYEYFPKFLPFDFFNGILVSADVHMIKPDIRIYQHLLEKYQLQAEECLFIDDRPENVEGAKKAGMQAVVFENNYDKIAEYIEK